MINHVKLRHWTPGCLPLKHLQSINDPVSTNVTQVCRSGEHSNNRFTWINQKLTVWGNTDDCKRVTETVNLVMFNFVLSHM